MPRLIVDGDACPVKEIVLRAAHKRGWPLLLVSNKAIAFGREAGVTPIVVPAGPDEADRWIVENVQPGDLVLTADLELAAGVIAKGRPVLGFRGEVLDAGNIGEALSLLAFHRSLRDTGLNVGGPKAFGPRERAKFAEALEKALRTLEREGAG